jgi:hypothetical protein
VTDDNHGADRPIEMIDRDLHVENEQLREENGDLRASALLWERLYHRAVERANDLQRALDEPLAMRGSRDGIVSRESVAPEHDRVSVESAPTVGRSAVS